MLTSIIRGVIRFRIAVLASVAAVSLFSLSSFRTIPLDAIPDISDPQVVIYAKWARSPEQIEAEVTAPLIRALIGSPDVRAVRATSHLGYSFIYVILRDRDRREHVRRMALDRINTVRPQLPPDATVAVGPNAGSLGWIYQYALVDRAGTRDLRELRLLNEARIKPALQALPGVAEVATVAGAPRDLVWVRPKKGQRYEGVLLSNGHIRLSDGREFRSPSGAAMAAAEVVSYDGWYAWRLDEGGPTLNEIRHQIAAAQASEEPAAGGPAGETSN